MTNNNFLDKKDIDPTEVELFNFMSLAYEPDETDDEDEDNDDNKMCPHCGSTDTWYNSSGLLQCDNCGYTEEI